MFYFLQAKDFRTRLLVPVSQVPHLLMATSLLVFSGGIEVSFWVRRAYTVYSFILGTSPKCICCLRCAQVERERKNDGLRASRMNGIGVC